MDVAKVGRFVNNSIGYTPMRVLPSYDINDIIAKDAIDWINKTSKDYNYSAETKLIGKEINSLKEACEFADKHGLNRTTLPDYDPELDLYV